MLEIILFGSFFLFFIFGLILKLWKVCKINSFLIDCFKRRKMIKIGILLLSLLKGIKSSSFNLYQLSTITNFEQGCQQPLIKEKFTSLYYFTITSFKTYSSQSYSATANLQDSQLTKLCETTSSTCSPNCCRNDACRQHYNTNGDRITPDQIYSVVYGGTESGLPLSTCYSLNPAECLSNASNRIYMINHVGSMIQVLPHGGLTLPKLYGHTKAYQEITEQDKLKKYVYWYGGRSSDCPGTICSTLYRYEIPYGPAAFIQNANQVEIISAAAGTVNQSPGAVFGHSMVQQNGQLFVFGGLRISNEVLELSFDKGLFYIFQIGTRTWTKISNDVTKNDIEVTYWDGSKSTFKPGIPEIKPRIMSLISNSGSPPSFYFFSGLVRSSASNEFEIYEDKWEIKAVNGRGQANNIFNPLQKFIHLVESENYCWTLYPSKNKWLILTQTHDGSSGPKKSQVRVLGPLDSHINKLSDSVLEIGSKGCGISLRDQTLVLLSGNNFGITKAKLESDGRILASQFGVNFCRNGYIGVDCRSTCPFSRTFSKPLQLTFL